MKTSLLTFFLCAVLGGVVYSAIVAGKLMKRETLRARTENVVNIENHFAQAQVSLQPLEYID